MKSGAPGRAPGRQALPSSQTGRLLAFRPACSPGDGPASGRPVRGGGRSRSGAVMADRSTACGAGERRWGRPAAPRAPEPAGEPVPERREDRTLPRPASRTRVPYRRHCAPARGASACSFGGSSAWGTCVRKGRGGVGRNGRRERRREPAEMALSRENVLRFCNGSCSDGRAGSGAGTPARDSASPARRPGSRARMSSRAPDPNRVAPSVRPGKGCFSESCARCSRSWPPYARSSSSRRRSPAAQAAHTTATATTTLPLITGHRGAPGYRPDHTLEGYKLAIEHGRRLHRAGPGLDEGRLPDRPARAEHRRHDRRREQVPRAQARRRRGRRPRRGRLVRLGLHAQGDQDAARHPAAQREPDNRPDEFDGLFKIPTFDEVLALAKREGRKRGRPVGVYPETKHPTYHQQLGLPLERSVVAALKRAGLNHKGAPVIIQSFESVEPKYLNRITPVTLSQLVDAWDDNLDGSMVYAETSLRPVRLDRVRRSGADGRTYGDLLTNAGLDEVAATPTSSRRGSRTSSRPMGTDANGDGEADDVNGDGTVDERDRQRRAADLADPARPQARARRPHVDVPQRAAPARLRLRRRSQGGVQAVLRAGHRRAVLGLPGHGRRRPRRVLRRVADRGRRRRRAAGARG